MIIGSALKPQAFKENTGKQWGFNFKQIRKHEWRNLWFLIGCRFDAFFIVYLDGRKIDLLLDSGLKITWKLFLTPHFVTAFLSATKVLKFQSMDAGVIAASKLRYHYMKMEIAIDFID